MRFDGILSEKGVVTAYAPPDTKAFLMAFRDAIAQHRNWDRDKDQRKDIAVHVGTGNPSRIR
jgi:hypothetical protein